MTTNELLMLVVGMSLGAQLMNLVHAYWASKDARRSAAQAKAAIKRAAGDHYLSSLRLYQIQQRYGVTR